MANAGVHLPISSSGGEDRNISGGAGTAKGDWLQLVQLPESWP